MIENSGSSQPEVAKGLGNLSPVIIEINYYLKQGHERPSSCLCKWEFKDSWVGWIRMTALKNLEKENDELGSLKSHLS